MQTLQTPVFRVDGLNALVTGGSKGIGLAVAHALATAGAHVCIAARDTQNLESAAQVLQASTGGVRVQTWPVDVTDFDAVAHGLAHKEPFQILVNNAGGNRAGWLVERSDCDIRAVLDLNVTSCMVMSREVVKTLIKAGLPGSIVNLSSQYGHVGAQERTLYSAAKHAVEGFTKSLAWEVGSHGIRVNTVSPSLVETDMTRTRLDKAGFRQEISRKTALGRIGQPQDIAGAVLFLASAASSFVTGTTIRVDGGATAV